ncbi:NAD-dependent succinate-semialdehyde dehydrogenase [Flavobacterium granuli]|uniref:Succinate-semialdehyde dehydrogenase / glutarate-semialdehyde dehydrogenase n=1 Tax=Flavobacterium granuli TaxID=280093 RepID=A0A1M5K764_9FLAO|nr:NAD-dependent succinate-semialdehyde dehydrogenase [Flavobacterium granuli]PRZ26187.1 succinate-semialdehyde dehydrogenase/glutarate-semialdehyde dehydrogenase [Flavobacterium granuli]SHG48627.1 succinate-semialdehyde dehydrogenase / glutarate-semialdehyde dehydrogenase [Flavobacterium granuli]
MQNKIHTAQSAFEHWSSTSFQERSLLLQKLKTLLEEHKMRYASLMTKEMGKPITQSLAEIDKCGWLCDYYAEHAKSFLKNQYIQTEAEESFISYEPLGVLLGVMPWNFPYWQVFRFVIPAIMAGNTVMVKHASNVPESAEAIESLFLESGFPLGIYQNLPISSNKVGELIAHPLIRAVSLTGSEKAGSAVAMQAGKYLKKTLLELGGSNAFIVCEDADLEQAIAVAVNARMQNSGQSCIAAKRFLVHERIFDTFVDKYKLAVSQLRTGDPMNPETQIGSLARVDLAVDLEKQVQQSVAMGAQVVLGGRRKEAFFEPTILIDVTPEMPVFKEETFGPVAALVSFETIDEAIALSNQSDFGLGVSVFTSNILQIKSRVRDFNEGAVFINDLVKSDPRLPFGGVKKSGYGRELSREGILEFVNCKTVVIRS